MALKNLQLHTIFEMNYLVGHALVFVLHAGLRPCVKITTTKNIVRENHVLCIFDKVERNRERWNYLELDILFYTPF